MVLPLDSFSTDQYDYQLPQERIAQSPIFPRDASRLLVIDRKEKSWTHRMFSDLSEYFSSGDLMIANNSKVLKARLLGQRVLYENERKVLGGKVEFVMLEKISPLTWEGLFHASGKYVEGFTFEIPTHDKKNLVGKLVRGSAASPHGTVVAQFDRDPIEAGAGVLPLPHYIERIVEDRDFENYQTVYASALGSAAAPTAGLHFTPQALERLKYKNILWSEVTLHVGLGTFRPVKVLDIRQHQMHEERYEVSQQTASLVNQTKKSNKKNKILAVGTTSMRVLESAWNPSLCELAIGKGKTSIFIYPGYKFHVADCLLTNFHLPRSTLLMLVCAFAGKDLVLQAYQDAIRNQYRFYSYGDAMLII